MLTPTTKLRGSRWRASITWRASSAAPWLLKPMRLMRASSAARRRRRGGSCPGCESGVTVPTSANPRPRAAQPRSASPSLSNPAPRPIRLRNASPTTSWVALEVVAPPAISSSQRPTPRSPAPRSARIERRWIRSGSKRNRSGRARRYAASLSAYRRIGSVVRGAREGHLCGEHRRQRLADLVVRDAGGGHQLVPYLGSGRRGVIELLDGDDPLEADQARVAVIGLELVLVLRGDLARPTQRGLLVSAVDQDDPVFDHSRDRWLADQVGVAQLHGEPAARIRE